MPYTFRYGDRPLDGITVQRAIGRGGFGEVYYALADSGKQIALKFLRDNPDVELRGISHVMNLKSPHLITIYDVRKNNEGEPFVLMEYVSGPSLREIMTAEPGGVGPQKAAFFVDGIAKGLSYLHDRGIVHRDLKPANIFYDDGYVKIGDYGLSKHISVSQHSGQTVSVGTVHYMAPEIGSGSYTKAIDIYALGVILYELLTGELPFTGSSMGEVLMRHLSDNPDLSGIPAPFAEVVAKALSKDPRDRYQDANEMLDALREFTEVSKSIATFDPTELTRVPRAEGVEQTEPTTTRAPRVPPPPPPPMDVRTPQPPQGVEDKLAAKWQKKADKVVRKLEKEAEKLRKKGAQWIDRQRVANVESDAAPHAGEARPRPRRGMQFLVLMAVAVAASIALSVATGAGREEVPVALSFCIIAGMFGPLLGYFKLLKHTPMRSPLWDRLTYVGATAVFMIPAFAIASDAGSAADQLVAVVGAALGVLLLCDWTKRIEDGRRGQVSGGAAFWAGVVGLIVASIFGAGGLALVGGCVAGMISLLSQAAAAMWPVSAPTMEHNRRHPQRRDWRNAADAAAPPTVPDVPDRVAAHDVSGKEPSGAAPARQTEAEQRNNTRPEMIIVDAAAPSFVGRTFNAGLGFLGKILLVGALALALCYSALSAELLQQWHAAGFDLPREVESLITAGIPQPLIMLAGVAGCAMLVLARRTAGSTHLVRGLVGCAFALWATVMALGPAQGAWHAVLTEDWGAVHWPVYMGPLVATIIPLAIAFVLVSWPRKRRVNSIEI